MSYMSLKIVQLRFFFFFMLRMIEKRKKMVVQLALVLMLLYHNSRKVHVPSEEVKVKGKTGSFFSGHFAEIFISEVDFCKFHSFGSCEKKSIFSL